MKFPANDINLKQGLPSLGLSLPLRRADILSARFMETETGRQNVDPPQSRRRENLPSSYIPGSFQFTVFAQNQQVVAADTAEIYGEYGGVYWQRLEIRDPTATGSAVRRFIRTRAASAP